MNEIEVRRAVPADAAQLCSLNGAFNGPDLADCSHIARSLAENDREIVCIALAGSTPAGFCCAQVIHSMCYPTHPAEITEMYVAPEYRRMGVGCRLMRLAEQLCIQQGADGFTLLTGNDNLPARQLYEACGYALSGEVHYEKN